MDSTTKYNLNLNKLTGKFMTHNLTKEEYNSLCNQDVDLMQIEMDKLALKIQTELDEKNNSTLFYDENTLSRDEIHFNNVSDPNRVFHFLMFCYDHKNIIKSGHKTIDVRYSALDGRCYLMITLLEKANNKILYGSD